MKPSIVNLSCCLLKQVSFLLFPLFCASLLSCSTALVRGPQALKYSLPLRPSFLKLDQGMHCIDHDLRNYVIPFTRRTPTPSTPPSPGTNTVYMRVYINEGNDVCTGSQFQEDLLSHGGIERVTEVANDSMEDFVIDDARKIPGISKLNNFNFSPESIAAWRAYARAPDLGGGCRGCAPLPTSPEKTCGFLIRLVFCKKKKKKKLWFISVEVVVHPLLKQILDLPLLWNRE